MTVAGKVVLAAVAIGGCILLARHASQAMGANLPSDMPRDAHFVQSGYDLNHNETKGDWIACRIDVDQNTDYCRVTDNRGMVVYQGDFLPLRSTQPLPVSELKVASNDAERMWVQGPAEQGPVPVITLANGRLLVPAADSDALPDRWAAHPEELRRVEGSL